MWRRDRAAPRRPVVDVARIGPIRAVSSANKGDKSAVIDRSGTHLPEHIDRAPARIRRCLSTVEVTLGGGVRDHGPDLSGSAGKGAKYFIVN